MEAMLKYRSTKSTDTPFLFELYSTTRSKEIIEWGWDTSQQATFLQMQFGAQRRSHAAQFPDAEHRILLFGGQPIGQVLVWRCAAEIRLIDIALLPAFHSRGLGSAVIRQLQGEAAISGRPLRLSVLRGNPARRLYERLGFVVTKESDLYQAMEWIPLC